MCMECVEAPTAIAHRAIVRSSPMSTTCRSVPKHPYRGRVATSPPCSVLQAYFLLPVQPVIAGQTCIGRAPKRCLEIERAMARTSPIAQPEHLVAPRAHGPSRASCDTIQAFPQCQKQHNTESVGAGAALILPPLVLPFSLRRACLAAVSQPPVWQPETPGNAERQAAAPKARPGVRRAIAR